LTILIIIIKTAANIPQYSAWLIDEDHDSGIDSASLQQFFISWVIPVSKLILFERVPYSSVLNPTNSGLYPVVFPFMQMMI
jgi:hypothetical protein